MNTKKRDNYYISFIVLLTAVVLLFCVAVGSVFAWLQFSNEYDNSESPTKLGEIALELYADGIKYTPTVTTGEGGVEHYEYTSPYLLDTTNVKKTPMLKVRNVGTIDALVRATINVYILDSSRHQVTLLTSTTPTDYGNTMSVALNVEGWVNNLSPSVACGNLFYNDKLSPYVIDGETIAENEISIVSNVSVPSEPIERRNTQIYLSVSVDAIAYAGNIYKKIKNNETTAEDIPVTAYPFGEMNALPSTWTAWW